jgi:hypothetical protein
MNHRSVPEECWGYYAGKVGVLQYTTPRPCRKLVVYLYPADQRNSDIVLPVTIYYTNVPSRPVE